MVGDRRAIPGAADGDEVGAAVASQRREPAGLPDALQCAARSKWRGTGGGEPSPARSGAAPQLTKPRRSKS
jgi:hypothetical protein